MCRLYWTASIAKLVCRLYWTAPIAKLAGVFSDHPIYTDEVAPVWGDQDVPESGMPIGYFAKINLSGGKTMAIPEEFNVGGFKFVKDEPLPKLEEGMIYQCQGKEFKEVERLTPTIAIMLLDGRIKIVRKSSLLSWLSLFAGVCYAFMCILSCS